MLHEDDDHEEEFEIDINEAEPEFLKGQSSRSGVEVLAGPPSHIPQHTPADLDLQTYRPNNLLCPVLTCTCSVALAPDPIPTTMIPHHDYDLYVLSPTPYPKQVSPIKIVKNPDGSMQRAAMTASALAKERRELKEQQQRTLLEAIPKDLSRRALHPPQLPSTV